MALFLPCGFVKFDEMFFKMNQDDHHFCARHPEDKITKYTLEKGGTKGKQQ